VNCIVTAGPTYEPLDEVRRLTNFSTGRLGSELVNFLADRGHAVTLLIGQQATFRGERRARKVETFTTTEDLRQRLHALSEGTVDAVFHGAAVSDFTFGKVWQRSAQGEMKEAKSGKISTRAGALLVELIPTAKIIAELRDWFPQACLVGWKYEVDGDRASVIAMAEKQIAENQTNACVANGRAYGDGFGLVKAAGNCEHCKTTKALFAALENLMRSAKT
jgi:phosphopantothenoylcysteine decarboxylase/phosphopantothenate--cysteine ligase